MCEFPDTLTPDQVYRFAVDFCQPHVDFHPAGKITATTLVTVSFAAAGPDQHVRPPSDPRSPPQAPAMPGLGAASGG